MKVIIEGKQYATLREAAEAYELLYPTVRMRPLQRIEHRAGVNDAHRQIERTKEKQTSRIKAKANMQAARAMGFFGPQIVQPVLQIVEAIAA